MRAARPAKLFFACDAPRADHPEESARVAAVRELLAAVDWPCEVHTRFPDRNLGCGVGVSSAISWFLEAAGEGIILEDDCLPTETFFRFCATMLERYRHDNRVVMITGSNMAPLIDLPCSYGFSRVASCWGWASWKRAWDKFSLTSQPISKNESWTRGLHSNTVNFLRRKLMAIASGRLRTWDYQFIIQAFRTNQLTVVPRRNLILNIGFEGEGTHFVKAGRPWMAPAFAYDSPDDWSDRPPFQADDRYDLHFLTAMHRGSSKLMRQVLKWRIRWARGHRPADAVLFD